MLVRNEGPHRLVRFDNCQADESALCTNKAAYDRLEATAMSPPAAFVLIAVSEYDRVRNQMGLTTTLVVSG